MCVHQAVEVFRWLAEIAPDLARLQRAFDTAIAARDAEDPSLVRTERRGFELGRGGDYSTHRYVEAQTNARNERAHSFWRIRTWRAPLVVGSPHRAALHVAQGSYVLSICAQFGES